MDVLIMEYVGWRSAAVAGRYVGAMASAAGSRGAEHSRDPPFIDADALPPVGGVLGARTRLSLGTTEGSRSHEGLD